MKVPRHEGKYKHKRKFLRAHAELQSKSERQVERNNKMIIRKDHCN